MDAQAANSAERMVEVDGRTIPVSVWERESILRCAAWTAIVQATILGASSMWRLAYMPAASEMRIPGLCVALTVTGFLLVRARVFKGVLALLVLGQIGAMLLCISDCRAPITALGCREQLPSLLPVLACVAGGMLLMRARPLGRDLLLVLSFAWLVSALPEFIDWTNPKHSSGTGLTSGPLRFDRDYGAIGLPGAFATVAPPLFVLLTMVKRPGRSVLPPTVVFVRLSPLRSMTRTRPTRRACCAVAMLLATTACTACQSDLLSRLFGLPW